MATVVQLRRTAQIQPDPAEKWRGGGMAVVVVASPAVGSGKTTLAAHLAVQAQHAGTGPVVVLDMATDGAVEKWRDMRGDRGPAVYHAPPLKLAETLLSLKDDGVRLCIVDTPAIADATSLGHAIAVADLILMPVRMRTREVGKASKLCKAIVSDGIVVVPCVRVQADEEQMFHDVFRRLIVTGSSIPRSIEQSSDFTAAMQEGGTVAENRKESRAAEEIARLWQDLRKILYDL